jgi:hypothetical protein
MRKKINNILNEIDSKILKLNNIKSISYLHGSKDEKKDPPKIIIDNDIIINGYNKIYNFLLKLKRK